MAALQYSRSHQSYDDNPFVDQPRRRSWIAEHFPHPSKLLRAFQAEQEAWSSRNSSLSSDLSDPPRPATSHSITESRPRSMHFKSRSTGSTTDSINPANPKRAQRPGAQQFPPSSFRDTHGSAHSNAPPSSFHGGSNSNAAPSTSSRPRSSWSAGSFRRRLSWSNSSTSSSSNVSRPPSSSAQSTPRRSMDYKPALPLNLNPVDHTNQSSSSPPQIPGSFPDGSSAEKRRSIVLARDTNNHYSQPLSPNFSIFPAMPFRPDAPHHSQSEPNTHQPPARPEDRSNSRYTYSGPPPSYNESHEIEERRRSIGTRVVKTHHGRNDSGYGSAESSARNSPDFADSASDAYSASVYSDADAGQTSASANVTPKASWFRGNPEAAAHRDSWVSAVSRQQPSAMAHAHSRQASDQRAHANSISVEMRWEDGATERERENLAMALHAGEVEAETRALRKAAAAGGFDRGVVGVLSPLGSHRVSPAPPNAPSPRPNAHNFADTEKDARREFAMSPQPSRQDYNASPRIGYTRQDQQSPSLVTVRRDYLSTPRREFASRVTSPSPTDSPVSILTNAPDNQQYPNLSTRYARRRIPPVTRQPSEKRVSWGNTHVIADAPALEGYSTASVNSSVEAVSTEHLAPEDVVTVSRQVSVQREEIAPAAAAAMHQQFQSFGLGGAPPNSRSLGSEVMMQRQLDCGVLDDASVDSGADDKDTGRRRRRPSFLGGGPPHHPPNPLHNFVEAVKAKREAKTQAKNDKAMAANAQ